MMPDIVSTSQTLTADAERSNDREQHWIDILSRTAQERKAIAAATKTLSAAEVEELARLVFSEIAPKALDDGADIRPREKELILRLIGELSGLGPLLELIASDGVEDIAINTGHIYVYRTKQGWQYIGPATPGIGSGLRVLIDRAGQRGPTPDYPIADAMLFSHPTAWRALQNLGGIGNVTVLPPGGETPGVRAFDTGPGVVVIDTVTRTVVPELRFDTGGKLARSGTPIDAAVTEALALPYFSAPPPKSTGRELFSPEWIDSFVESCRRHRPGATAGDLVASAVALTARSIADAFHRFIPEPVTEVLVSGGGAENPALIDALSAALPSGIQVRRFADVYFDGEAKEAVAFALLGWLFLENKPGNVVTVTGARGPRILGKLTPGRAPL